MTGELMRMERRGPVCTLTLDSPHNRNALSARLLDELGDGLARVVADETVRVMVLTATGTVFCSGADLSEQTGQTGHSGQTGQSGRTGAVTSRLPEILTLLRTAPMPVVARVGGHARAGGMGLVAACDLAVATARCTFAFSEVRVGVAPAMILVPASRVMEPRFLRQATLTGESFGAARGAEVGLLTDVVDDDEALDAWVQNAISSILTAAPGAVAATKALLDELPALSWSEGLTVAQARSAALFAGAEATEGMAAFLEKRTPPWVVTPS